VSGTLSSTHPIHPHWLLLPLLQIWLDIETNPSGGCGWSDQNSNCNFMQGLVNAMEANGINCEGARSAAPGGVPGLAQGVGCTLTQLWST
jgi:hypothetical protein